MVSATTEQLAWVERVATFFMAQYGVPAIMGRIQGWLMICEPRQQSAQEIADAIGASRASLTTNLRLLIEAGFVAKLTKPGTRVGYYEIQDDSWERVIRKRIESLASFRTITADGLREFGVSSSRIAAADRTFQWMATVFEAAPALDAEEPR
jgi:DNA-binding transcriptional regulator GbsR (MarR family)